MNQRFGMGYVVEVIRGANNQRIATMDRDKLKSMAWAVIKPERLGERDPPAIPRPGDAKCAQHSSWQRLRVGAARRILFATCRAAYRSAQTESDTEIVRQQL